MPPFCGYLRGLYAENPKRKKAFRVNGGRQQESVERKRGLNRRKRRIARRLRVRKRPEQARPMFTARNILYELADRIVNLFTGRWSIEVTFQEVRAHLGFTAPRNWSKRSVLRTAPCLLGLFSGVSLIYARHARDRSAPALRTAWYVKKETTFSEAMTTVRRLCWESAWKESWKHTGVTKLPTRLRHTLLDHLSHAA